jgi:hypothetical protein
MVDSYCPFLSLDSSDTQKRSASILLCAFSPAGRFLLITLIPIVDSPVNMRSTTAPVVLPSMTGGKPFYLPAKSKSVAFPDHSSCSHLNSGCAGSLLA